MGIMVKGKYGNVYTTGTEFVLNFVGPIPASIADKLTKYQRRVSNCLLDMISREGLKNRKGSMYCYPSLEWIAKRCECSIRTVSRTIKLLKEFKVITWIKRRRVYGVIQTNLYKFGIRMYQIYQYYSEQFAKLDRHWTFLSNTVKRNTPSYSLENDEGVLSVPKVVPESTYSGGKP